MEGLQNLFNTGIAAAREVLVARASNDPTPNNRGNNDVTAQAGQPAGGVAAMLGGNSTVLLLLGVGLVVYLIARR
jgi:hypothetical protein